MHIKNKSLLFFIVISIFSTNANSNKTNLLYNGFTANYDVSKNDFQLGVSERRLIRKSTKQYQYRSRTYATGMASWFVKDKITESSYYRLVNNKIIPSRYDYKNSNGKPNDNFSIIFDSQKNTVTRTKDNKQLTIAENAQDLLSFQIAIMLAMQQKNKNIKFTIADNESIAEYSLGHTKDENLKTDKGEIKTRVMESNLNKNKDHYIFWCAKKYDYLPIKIKRIEANGDVLLIQINRINGQKISFSEPPDDEEFY